MRWLSPHTDVGYVSDIIIPYKIEFVNIKINKFNIKIKIIYILSDFKQKETDPEADLLRDSVLHTV